MNTKHRTTTITLAAFVLLLAAGFMWAASYRVPASPLHFNGSDSARAADSIAVTSAAWEVLPQNGFTLKTINFTDKSLFKSNQHFCMLEFASDSPCRLAFALAEDTVLNTSELALRADAVAAVNGSYFDMSHFNPICYLRIEGKEVGINTPQAKGDTNIRKYYQYASIRLSKGRPRLFVPDSNRFAERNRPDSNIMTAGPMLVWRGQTVPQRQDRTFCTYRHNRTALGIRRDGSFILFVADGRAPQQAAGLSLDELSLVMKWLGCYNAINLDGGGSTTLYVRGYKDRGIVNYPTDNGRYDHHGERPVSNAILVLK